MIYNVLYDADINMIMKKTRLGYESIIEFYNPVNSQI